MFWQALTLQLGYNAALVTLGACLLGIACGAIGAFLVLSRRALISDAISHSTLPGVALAYLVMAGLGGTGRTLWALLAGSALSAGIGLLAVSSLTRRTRLSEDVAIGAVLSVFFGFGIILLTIIQTMQTGQQAGLESFLLGSTSGMLWNEAVLIAVGGAMALAATWVLRRPMVLVAFDREFAAGSGINVRRVDLLMMGLALAVTVFGLKIVGLILIVAMLIIPPVAARFWTNRVGVMVMLSALIGGTAAYSGAAISATAPALPTGPIIVLASFVVFLISMFIAPERGVVASLIRHMRFRRQVHLRQGLLALAQGQPIYEALTLRLLRGQGLVRQDGVATQEGRAQAARALLDEDRWRILRNDVSFEATANRYDGLTPIDTVLTQDQIAEIDQRLPKGAVT